jgi:TRAP-type transport system periplasmic protein
MSKKLLIAAIVAAISITASTAGSAKEFIYGSWVSAKHGVNKAGLTPMFKAVEKETNGTVKWKLLAGGQVVSARSTLAGIRDRIVDGGLVIQVFTRKDLKTNNAIFDMQAFGDDPVAVAGAATEMVMLNCPQCLKEYKKNKNVYLGGYGVTPFQLTCKENLTTVAQFKGKKIRAVGAGKRWVKGMGAVPVAMPPTEAVTAMQRGAIDCVLASIAWLRSYGYIDVVKTFVEFNTGFPRGICVFCMNRSSWDSLTDSEKRVMWKHMPGVSARSTIIGYIQEDAKVKKLALAKGIKFVKGGDDFKMRMKAHKVSERAAIPKSMKKLGVKGSEKLMARFFEIYPKWEKLSKSINNDVDKFSAALQDQIYSKIDPTKW